MRRAGLTDVRSRAILSLASLAVALLAAEIAVRVADGVPVFLRRNFVVERLSIVRQNARVVVHDPMLGWRLADDYDAGMGFMTGAYGVRMNGAERVPLRHEAILAVGDSFTAGSGVANNESWPAQLEREIGEPVLNAACGGWAVDQAVLRAEQLAELVRPRTLIVGILGQDSLRNTYELYGGGYKPYFVPVGDGLELRGVPVPRITKRGVELDLLRRTVGYSYLAYWATRRAGAEAWWVANKYGYKQVLANEDGVRISCLLMDRLRALQARSSLRVVVLMQYGGPESQGAEPPWYGPPVLKCAEARGFDTVDTYPPLHALSVSHPREFKALWLNEGGQLGHMSAAGNRLIADLLRDRVTK